MRLSVRTKRSISNGAPPGTTSWKAAYPTQSLGSFASSFLNAACSTSSTPTGLRYLIFIGPPHLFLPQYLLPVIQKDRAMQIRDIEISLACRRTGLRPATPGVGAVCSE